MKYLLSSEIQNNNLSCFWKLSSNVLTIKPWTPPVWKQRSWFWTRLVLRKVQVFFNYLTFSELNLSTLFWSRRKPEERFFWEMGNLCRFKGERGCFFSQSLWVKMTKQKCWNKLIKTEKERTFIYLSWIDRMFGRAHPN